MKARFLAVLTVANFALLLLLVGQQVRHANADTLEIVDDQGRVRASLDVLPASRSASGEQQSETVLLRLMTEKGRP